MGFFIDTASINAASKRLEVIGNNVANANTVGFKGAEFEAVLATSMSGDVGTKKAGTRQSFSQGNISDSSNPLDLAVSGKGFFRVQNQSGAIAYTRNGQFSLDKGGQIVNATGDQLTGFAVDVKTGTILSGAPVPLSINQADFPPTPTTLAKVNLTLDSRESTLDTAVQGYRFTASDPNSYTHSTTTTVYNNLGEARDVQTFFTKVSPNQWEVHAAVDGVLVTQPQRWTMTFGANGQLSDSTGTDALGMLTIPVDGNPVSFDMRQAAQFGASFEASSEQNGTAIGQLTGYSVGSDGIITTRYSNGKSAVQGQLVLANFQSLDGLLGNENNQWTETTASGPAVLNKPGESGAGTLESFATEEANIDLTTEMIKMITAQRVYQAAAEMVKKQDEILQTVVNISR